MSAKSPDGNPIDLEENKRRMENGEFYYAFTPDLIKERTRCSIAVKKFNRADCSSRREMITLWKDIVDDKTPLPEKKEVEEEDDAQLENYPWVEGPVKVDYGTNIKFGKNVFINSNSTWIDTCTITIGDRVMFGPGVSLYSGGHPVDARVRNGTSGPEFGGKITIGEDCWIGGNVIILPGITIGRGTTIGAGSVVTKDIPAESVAVGNPARVIKKIDTSKPPVLA